MDVLCPGGHSLEQVSFVSKVYSYNVLRRIDRIRAAITSASPDFIIPADDVANAQLHKLYELTDATQAAGDRLRRLIEYRLGIHHNIEFLRTR